MTPERLAEVHALCFTRPRPWSAAEFAGLITMPGVVLTVEDTGFALTRTVAGEAELLTIAVPPVDRRKGLGKRLLSRAEAAAHTLGATEMFLEVAADNAPAIALYTGAGFAQAGLRHGYYRDGGGPATDARILRKTLTLA